MELAAACRKAEAGQCFSGWEKFDLVWKGQKVAGAAQRRKREGFLIQGSVQPPPLSITRAGWEKAMREKAETERNVEWVKFRPDQELNQKALDLAAKKYSTDAYNRKR